MQIEKNDIIDISPYIDSFSFFLNYEPMNDKYKNLFKSINDNGIIDDFLPNYIGEIIHNFIIIHNTDKEEIKEQKMLFLKSPQKAYDFLLSELHKIYLGKQIFKFPNNSPEICRDNAFNTFKDFMEQDKSYISENFYGLKLIEKKCQKCKKMQYIFKYIKSIPIKIKDINEENELDFEKCLKKLQNKFSREETCPFCKKKRNFEIKIRIERYPKLMIFVFYGNEKYARFKIKNNIRHGEYELIASEIKSISKFDNLLEFFCKKRNNYRFMMNEPITEKIFEDSIPLVLFYKKRAQMLIEIKTEDNSRDSFCSSNKTTENGEKLKKENVEITKLVEEKNNNSNKKIVKKNSGGSINITLFFKIEKNEKEFSLKTNNKEPFKNIIIKLKKKYGLKDIDEDKIIFNNIKIEMEKTPKDYNIKDGSHIIIAKE